MSIEKRELESYEALCKAISDDDPIRDAYKEILETYYKDLKETALKFDVEEFKNFVKRWKGRGIYPDCFELPTDEILEITIRKIVVNMKGAPIHKQAEATYWLSIRGYDLELE